MTLFSYRILIILLTLIAQMHAEDEKTSAPPKPTVEELSTTEHKIKLNGQLLEYKAICGNLAVNHDDNVKTKATLYYTAYIKNQPQGTSTKQRPLIFCFNGGPGSSSIWLHMGLLGPKKVFLNDATFTKPPAHYVDNPYTFLDNADLVFIDPVSTGFSRLSPESDPKQFHCVEGDAESFAEFIRIFLTHYQRWQSPKYLMGESYGTIRAISLANHMHDVSFIDMNGIILVSMCLDFQAYDCGSGNDLPYIVNLPTYAACAWYHKKLPEEHQNKSLAALLAEVEKFALHEYATALLLGDALDEDEREALVQKLSDYTGLRKDFIRASHLRIYSNNFYRELLKKDSKVIGRFDGRYVGYDANYIENPTYVPDPSFETITGPFTSAFHQYLYENLKVAKSDPYYVLNANAVFPWSFSVDRTQAGLGYLHMSGKLRELVEKNPSMQVFVLSGIYDLATPYFAAEYTLKHLKLDPTLRKNVQVKTYEAGHMMYINPKVHAEIKTDLANFLKK